MSFVDLTASPLAPGESPVRIHYRTAGDGPPILFLHGGWGYAVYPCDRQASALGGTHRLVIPDRSGYGASQSISELPEDFHHRAAAETLALLDALHLERPLLWGHSDGAIIALLIGLDRPQRIGGVIAEATHLYKRKPSSQSFFESNAANPQGLGPSVVNALARDHGDAWRAVLQRHSRAWLRIGENAIRPNEDFYDGRLNELRVPLLVVHGARDPRTEPGELEALRAALGSRHRFEVLPEGGHSPHSERATSDAVTKRIQVFASDVLDVTGAPGR